MYFFLVYLIDGLSIASLFVSLIWELLKRKFCRHLRKMREKKLRAIENSKRSIKKKVILLILKWFNGRRNYKSTKETQFIVQLLSKLNKKK